MREYKNIIIASVLSVAIMAGFDFFYKKSGLMEAETKISTCSSGGGSCSLPDKSSGRKEVASTSCGVSKNDSTGPINKSADRELVVRSSERVSIKSKSLFGSINLTGLRIDDLVLREYCQETNNSSKNVELLSPEKSAFPYFVEFIWSDGGSGVIVPDERSVWASSVDSVCEKEPATFSWKNPDGVEFRQIVSVDDGYMFTVRHEVIGAPSGAKIDVESRIVRMGKPITAGVFVLHEGLIGVFDGKLREISYDDVVKGGEASALRNISRYSDQWSGWIGITDKYWLVSLAPAHRQDAVGKFISHKVGGIADINVSKSQDGGSSDVFHACSSVRLSELQGGMGENGKMFHAGNNGVGAKVLSGTVYVFAGAKQLALLDRYEEKLGITHFDLAVDFGWFYFMTKPLFYFLSWMKNFCGSFGVAIVLMTIMIKLLFFPLSLKSYKSMTALKRISPKIEEIKKRNGSNKAKINQEMMELYKREKVSPASGCLPMLVQIPVFFALYKVLFVSIEMRHAPFLWWVKDLSAPDPTNVFTLFGLVPWGAPDFLQIGAWPLVMGISMIAQQVLNPSAASDPAQKVMFLYVMPCIFTYMLAQFPVGLVIYWTASNFLTVLQQWVMMRAYGDGR